MIKVIDHKDNEHVSIMIRATADLISQLKIIPTPNTNIVWSEDLMRMKTENIDISDEIHLADAYIILYKFTELKTQDKKNLLKVLNACKHSKIYICTMAKDNEIEYLETQGEIGAGALDIKQSGMFTTDNLNDFKFTYAVSSGFINLPVYGKGSLTKESLYQLEHFVNMSSMMFVGNLADKKERILIVSQSIGLKDVNVDSCCDVIVFSNSHLTTVEDGNTQDPVLAKILNDNSDTDDEDEFNIQDDNDYLNDNDEDKTDPDADLPEWLDDFI